MAWQGAYYYRKRREGGRVVSEYVGAGYAAELLAQLDEQERLQAAAQQEAFKRLIAEQRAIDDEVDAVDAALAALVDAVLLVSGYHQHKRTWRLKRDRQDN